MNLLRRQFRNKLSNGASPPGLWAAVRISPVKRMIFFFDRIAEMRPVCLIGQWLKTGVLKAGRLLTIERGIRRGVVISRAKLYLHYAYDLCVHHWRRIRSWAVSEIRSACERVTAAAPVLFAPMLARFSANFSLWPERGRPQRAPKARRRALAGAGVCAIAAFSIIFRFDGPVTVREPAAGNQVLTFLPAVAPDVTSGLQPVESVHRRSPTRARAARVTLPIIGTHAMSGVATDGRGEGLPDRASGLTLATSYGDPSTLIEGEPVLQPLVEVVGASEEKPATASERPIKLHKKIIRERRERPTTYAARQKRERPASYAKYRKRERPRIYVARYRHREQIPRYAMQSRRMSYPPGLVTPTSIWY